jgi:hypothetical protein
VIFKLEDSTGGVINHNAAVKNPGFLPDNEEGERGVDLCGSG